MWKRCVHVCVQEFVDLWALTGLRACCHIRTNCGQSIAQLPHIHVVYIQNNTQTLQRRLNIPVHLLILLLPKSPSLLLYFLDASLISQQCRGSVYLSSCGNIPCDSVNKPHFKIHLLIPSTPPFVDCFLKKKINPPPSKHGAWNNPSLEILTSAHLSPQLLEGVQTSVRSRIIWTQQFK